MMKPGDQQHTNPGPASRMTLLDAALSVHDVQIDDLEREVDEISCTEQ